MIHSPRRLRSIVPVFFTRRKIGKGVPSAAGKKDRRVVIWSENPVIPK